MISNIHIIRYLLSVMTLSLGLFSVSGLKAMDPFNFCNNTCHAPSCDPNSQDPLVQRITEECRTKCESVYAQVAQLQMSKAFGELGKAYRKASKEAKAGMWSQSPIGQCLGKGTSTVSPSSIPSGVSIQAPINVPAKTPGQPSLVQPSTPFGTPSTPQPSAASGALVKPPVSQPSAPIETPSKPEPSVAPAAPAKSSMVIKSAQPSIGANSAQRPGTGWVKGPQSAVPLGPSSKVFGVQPSAPQPSKPSGAISVDESLQTKIQAEADLAKAKRDAAQADKIKAAAEAEKRRADTAAAKAKADADAAKGHQNEAAADMAKKKAEQAKQIADEKAAKAKADADLKNKIQEAAAAAKAEAEAQAVEAKKAAEAAKAREQAALAKAKEHEEAAAKAKAELAKVKEEAERKAKEAKKMPTKLSPAIILSIDGAAVKGIAQADILIALEREVNKILQDYAKDHKQTYRYLKITDLFDFFAGTSAGSLNVGFILVPKDVKTANVTGGPVQPMYTLQGLKERIPDILKAAFVSPFKRRVRVVQVFGTALAGSKYSSKPIEEKFDEIAGETRMSDLVKPAIITSQDWVTYEPVIFSTVDSCSVDPNEKVFYQQRDRNGYLWKDSNVYLKDAMRASMAAQSFFKPKELTVDGQKRVLVDGGNIAQNPAWVAHVYAQEYFKDRPLTIISISGGLHVTKEGKVLRHKVKARGKTAGKILSIIEPTISGGMQGQQLLTDQMMERIPNLKYHRLHFDITNNQFDDTSPKNQKALHEAAQKTIDSNDFKEAVKSIANAIIERKEKNDLKPFVCKAKIRQQENLSSPKDRQIGITAFLIQQREKLIQSCKALAKKKLKSLTDRRFFQKNECKKHLIEQKKKEDQMACRSLGQSEAHRRQYKKMKCAKVLAEAS